MSGLAITRAPPAMRPLRFLLTAPLWGAVAGGWLLLQGPSLLVSRWALPTVALVHLFTLGVLGNAMLGSLLQFLPVAAGAPLPWPGLAPWLHAGLNLGLALFAALLAGSRPAWLWLPGGLMAAVLLLFAALALAGLLRGHGVRLLRAGIGLSLACLAATAGLGLLAAAILSGRVALPLPSVADLHAGIGLWGWVLALMAAVGSVTLPMFQGTRPLPPAALRAWLWTTLLGLLAGAGMIGHGAQVLRIAGASLALAFAAASLWLQLRAHHRRNLALALSWGCGSLAVAAAASVALLAPRADIAPVLAGTLAIAIGLPLMLHGMQLEITGFIAWVELRRRCPRGLRIPGVDGLFPERRKRLLFVAHAGAAALLAAATAMPGLTRTAGAALLLAYACSFVAQCACLQRARRFSFIRNQRRTSG
ncbi:hypothetical protein OK348_01655 [Flavobacterium sp. MXW15]|uniref:Permease n=1 Tax=Xanthomonas chitinilytica TaxID=2989819 RepID=A0ABT3JUH7_9XANT|nr:hypothetical protein [Xanthomonas sp. H13-6]MCW4453511.1 hypothetical protein [Flavobacterium sp. MXW15]MCW4472136.1 hypothetical protein [Xanthomonas sp. H13-6]